jgi:hypothetical protein
MLDVAVTEIGLQAAHVVALVSQCIAASVPEHVRMRLEPQLGLGACTLNHAREASGAEGCAPFRREHKRRSWYLVALKASQRAQYVAEDRMGARRAMLDPADVQDSRPEVPPDPSEGPQVQRHAGPADKPRGSWSRRGGHGGFPWLCRQPLDLGFSVRYSRVRSLPFGNRLGVTVRFTVAGMTSLRCDLAMCSTLPC